MKIKSLLAASAALLVSAPAFAADVIIAEPEPVDYVEVCDVAGAGYFYIPGSQTCLQISGLVRHQLSFVEDQDGWDSEVRGELTARTYTETELGALTSFLRFRANDQNRDPLSVVVTRDGQNNIGAIDDVSLNGSAFLQDAVIGLGGLSLGMSDSLYDGGIAGEFDAFGGSRVHFIRYTADLGAFSASISAEVERENESRNDFVPNVVGAISGDVGAFSVDIAAYYADEDENDGDNAGLLAFASDQDDDEYGAKIRLGADFGPAALALGATYNSGDTNGDYDNGYEYSVAASATVGLGEKASLTFGGQYFFNQLNGAGFNPAVQSNAVLLADGTVQVNPATAAVFTDSNINDDVDAFTVGANVNYEIVEGFDALIAVNYAETVIDGDLDLDDDDGTFSGFIRFDRSF